MSRTGSEALGVEVDVGRAKGFEQLTHGLKAHGAQNSEGAVDAAKAPWSLATIDHREGQRVKLYLAGVCIKELLLSSSPQLCEHQNSPPSYDRFSSVRLPNK